ncbi:MAG: exodeoxyribonuclease III [Candidatus Portnoybacteria bacterium RBG_13_40_8]|uniref:Exodeoxyribonuclease III n=1 Tax=Candidatus Portnoybacteria bacterium RBG_13_40_8 TaxID=1801990 RepID=A0A1G2F2E6_9BACT|nr:MAG: exodeoxyribonuclease III [Candidatus Portnoybacteria bacterium RBG_13_40_8]OGZ34624.1 MAG: exodeoxyribonuclease III [Candidatus Portnoybacteria bacterium RIFCSPHIGHO2_01_FULL_39_19]
MKIVSWNVNGIRAVYRKNFLGWLEKTNADIVCLQEVKIQTEQLPPDLANPKNYYSFFNFANKKGYSGVAVYVRKKPLSIENKLGVERFDTEGRILKLKFPKFLLINIYLPHGGRQKENLKYKLKAYQQLLNYLKKIRNKNIILIGDFNVAHQEIDLARPNSNKNNIMFTPKERKQIDKIIEFGFADSFRKFHKDNGHYTWWPYAFNARERNLGWRIDYAFISKSLAPKIKNAFILDKVPGSDHCPIGIEI